MEPKRKRGRPRTMERERTVMTAMENYWREGPQALSINEICRRTNLSKPSLYREFGGEDGLLDAALACYDQEVIAPMAAASTTESTFAEMATAMIQMLTTPRDGPRGCLLVKMRSAPNGLGPRTRTRITSMVQRLQQSYTQMFLYGRDRDEVLDDVDPELAGRYIDTQITNILRQMGAREDPEEIKAQANLAFSALMKH